MLYSSNVNGFLVEGIFDDENVEKIFKPLLKKLIELQAQKESRFVVFISAPPAVGKSTLVNFLVHLAETELAFDNIQSIGIDGFHYYNDYLAENGLSSRKGAVDTFDVDRLHEKLEKLMSEDVYFPIYDRNLHNPVEDAVLVNKKIVLLEGNYLASNNEKWKRLSKFCDYSIFLDAKENFLKDRLVSRKIKGGKTEEEALDFYEKSDSINVRYVLNNKIETDMILELSGFKYNLKKGEF